MEDLLWLDRDREAHWLHDDFVTFSKNAPGGLALLSNMSSAAGPFAFPATTIGGVTIGPVGAAPTSEHVFQAFKAALSGRPDKAQLILGALTPERCKALTSRRSMKMTPEALERWERLSPEAMLAVARAKFGDPNGAASAALLATGSATLVERLARFPDSKWGVRSNGRGANLMGQILMRVRDELRERSVTKDP